MAPSVNGGSAMALPFDLPRVTRGYAALCRGARDAGARAAQGAARALIGVLGADLAVEGRPVAAEASPAAAQARLGIELAAVGEIAVLEGDAPLVALLVDRLAGGPGDARIARAPTPAAAAAVELLALSALDGACAGAPELHEAWSPRIARRAPGAVPSALCVDVLVSAGDLSGRARLLVPARAVAALRAPAPPASRIRVGASLRSGSTALGGDDLAALAPGDVVLLDAGPGERGAIVLPGGVRLAVRIRDGELVVEEEASVSDLRSEIPVTIEVELARFPVALADLASLEPGAVLAAPIDRRGLVTLRAGDHAFARGELVDVDGAVGVRILAVEVAP
jgi:type III secretion system YscQ/HrcQ family protein